MCEQLRAVLVTHRQGLVCEAMRAGSVHAEHDVVVVVHDTLARTCPCALLFLLATHILASIPLQTHDGWCRGARSNAQRTREQEVHLSRREATGTELGPRRLLSPSRPRLARSLAGARTRMLSRPRAGRCRAQGHPSSNGIAPLAPISFPLGSFPPSCHSDCPHRLLSGLRPTG